MATAKNIQAVNDFEWARKFMLRRFNGWRATQARSYLGPLLVQSRQWQYRAADRIEKAKVQFPLLNRLRSVLWGLGLVLMLTFAVMCYLVAFNPRHRTSQYPESVKINGIARYMTLTELRIIEISFLLALFCAAANISIGWYIRDMSNGPPQP